MVVWHSEIQQYANAATILAGTPPDSRDARALKAGTCYGNSPKTATPFGVPTNTLPFTIVGVMNLLPAPN